MEKFLSPSDLLQIKKISLISDLDKQILIDLYAPIIGLKSTSFYLALANISSSLPLSHEKLMSKVCFGIKEIVESLNSLEAVGLVDTFVEKGETSIYSYCLYCPHMPDKFFNNPFLMRELQNAVGENIIKELANKYKTDDLPNGTEKISMSFNEYFHPDLSYQEAKQSLKHKTGGKISKKIGEDIDYNDLFAELRKIDWRFKIEQFSDKELQEIASISSLYCLSYVDAAFAISDSFTFKNRYGMRLDVEAFAKNAQKKFELPSIGKPMKSDLDKKTLGDSKNALFFKDMETINPIEFLSRMQNNHKPSGYDMSVVQMLRNDIGLSDPAINALISYVLKENNNILSRGFCELLGAELVRAKISNSMDAYNYLKNRKKFVNRKKYKNDEEKQNAPVTKLANEKQNEEEMSDDEFAKLLEGIGK